MPEPEDTNLVEIADMLKAETSLAIGVDHKARITLALDFAVRYGNIDGGHHKMWVIDQMFRALTGCPMVTRTAKDYKGKEYTYEEQGESALYHRLVVWACDGEDGPHTYGWDVGIPP